MSVKVKYCHRENCVVLASIYRLLHATNLFLSVDISRYSGSKLVIKFLKEWLYCICRGNLSCYERELNIKHVLKHFEPHFFKQNVACKLMNSSICMLHNMLTGKKDWPEYMSYFQKGSATGYIRSDCLRSSNDKILGHVRESPTFFV